MGQSPSAPATATATFPYTKKGVTYSPNGAVTHSLFGSIALGSTPPSGTPPTLLYKGASLSAFAAAKPCSTYHALVVTQEHVKSHLSLRGPDGLSLLAEMTTLGEEQ